MPKLTVLTEHSPFMMAYVFVTEQNRAVVIDGGNPEDIPYLKELIGGRRIAAWILTHPHFDHISGFCVEMESGDLYDSVDRIYYNFPSADFVLECEPNTTPCSILDFNRILPKIQDKTVLVTPGLTVDVDELHIEFLTVGGEQYRLPKPNLAVNESSLSFKVTSAGMRSVLFLGDMGPCGGRELMQKCPEKLKSDIVQMAHHGHSGVCDDVYRKIAPTACVWNAPDWLWEEPDVELEPEIFGTVHQRKLMDELGVTEHYVTMNGTQEIKLFD